MASSSCQTHYEILGIKQQAQLKEIKEAYRKLALKCHPDKDPHNPRAVATFQKLVTAYETLSDGNRRTIYDATLPSSQRARQMPQPANWAPQRSYDWHWQARREDTSYWSGETYAHGTADRSGSGKQRGPEQMRDRAAEKKAHKEAESKRRDMNRPPPQDPFDQETENVNTRAEKSRKKKEARAKAEREAREDDENWGKPPSPQKPHSDRWYKTEEEKLEKKKKKRADRRKAEREQSEKQWSAELLTLLSKIINIEVDIDKTEAKADESTRAAKSEREDEDQEQIFHLQIKRKSLERRLQERVEEYKRIVKLLRDWGREQEANEADVKLREARKEVTRDERAGRKGSSQGEQAQSTTKTKRKGQAEKARAKPPASSETSLPDPKFTIPQPSEPSKAQRSNTELSFRTKLPFHNRQDVEDTTQQQQASREYVTNPGVSYDGSDPDQGYTEDTPESSIAGDNYDYDDEDYDPPFCNDFHDSHMEVHR